MLRTGCFHGIIRSCCQGPSYRGLLGRSHPAVQNSCPHARSPVTPNQNVAAHSKVSACRGLTGNFLPPPCTLCRSGHALQGRTSSHPGRDCPLVGASFGCSGPLCPSPSIPPCAIIRDHVREERCRVDDPRRSSPCLHFPQLTETFLVKFKSGRRLTGQFPSQLGAASRVRPNLHHSSRASASPLAPCIQGLGSGSTSTRRRARSLSHVARVVLTPPPP